MSATTAEGGRAERSGGLSGFWALIATQFQGAFNDNAFKFIIIFSLPAILANQEWGVQWERRITPLSTFLFTVPFVLFPGYAGTLGDRFSKRTVAIATKYWELLVMMVGLAAFVLREPLLIWAMLFMMAMQSTFFSPAKYGILPETLPEERLSWANGILNMTTFVAIILGTAVAGILLERLQEQVYLTSVPLIVLSLLGLATAHGMARAPAADPARRVSVNPWSGLGRCLKVYWQDRPLYMTLLGVTYFWFAGLVIQQNVVEFGKTMEYSHTVNSLLQVSLALGIGLGSFAAGLVSRRKIEVGLVPLGAVGLTVCCGLLAIPGLSSRACCGLLFVLGFSGGFYYVPLIALLQQRSPDNMKGGMIAASNFVNFGGMLVAAGLFLFLFSEGGLSTQTIFLIMAGITFAVSIYIFTILPLALLRFVMWALVNTLYRMRVVGAKNVPERGGALLIANHTSFVDALVLTASIDRPIRFLMSEEIYNNRWIRPIAKMAQAIPISTMSSPKDMIRSLRTATEAIGQGDLVCIFAEGQISRTGQMLPFRKGFEHIMKRVDAPMIPCHLDRLWGSIFSYSDGKFFWKCPMQLPFPVTVSYGQPMPNDTPAAAVRTAIQQLGSDAYMLRKDSTPLLHRHFIKRARRHPKALAMADMRVPQMSYFKAYIASIIFARKLHALLGKEEMVGLLVPQSVGAALSNIALQIMGRAPVNLNYTASPEALQSSVDQCGIRHVLTSKAFLEKFPVDVPGEAIYLEDVKQSVRSKDRILAMLLAVFCPVGLLERSLGAPKRRTPDDLATVIFSSGSEGAPKGVMLTHFNIASNMTAPLEVFPHERTDGIMGILPFFHSFGFTGTLWMPLSRGMFVVFHPSPLEAKAIGQLMHKYGPRFLIGTPTFLQNFIRKCLPEELSSADYVIAGAEKLPDRIREAFKARFGVEPLEGYGATECAPIVSVNVPDFRAPGYYQIGTKHGTIGHPIPGVCVRVLDQDTGELILDGRPGLLQVRGPNIMRGYLAMPDKTAEVLQDGWYSTGDIGAVDEDGFIRITDRVSRFSKIGGEMVPHGKVEEDMHEMLGLTERAISVTGVPDERKGERLIVLHTLDSDQVETLLKKLDASSMPRLWIPRASAFYEVEEIPILGTGKVDLKRLKMMAAELDVGE